MSTSIVDFAGFGKYIASKRETNAEVAARLGIPEEEILRKSGIGCRYIATADEPASQMALAALKMALEQSGLEAKQLGGIIVSTFSGDYLYPNTAARLARELKINDCFAFDLQANCAGFQMGLAVARDRLIADPKSPPIAVVGVARQSPYLDPKNPETAFFFSDAGSAAILKRRDGQGGLLPAVNKTNGHNYELVRLRGGGSSFPLSPALFETDPKALYYEHSGLGVWSEVIVEFPKLIRQALDSVGWVKEDVDLFLFHQANLRLIEYLMARLRAPMTKTFTNVEKIGNTADASLGTVLYDAQQAGKLAKSGTKVLLASVGAGFVYSVTPYVVPA